MTLYALWDDVTWFGGISFFLFLLLLSFAFGDVSFGWRLAAGIALTGFLTVAVRSVYFKHRPKRIKYTSYFSKMQSSSFPSLHAMRSWMLAALVWAYYSVWLAVAAIIIAVLVSISRHKLRRHFTTDIIAGAVFGMLIGFGLGLL
jgi:membrane-associated phospholipid phosphatase